MTTLPTGSFLSLLSQLFLILFLFLILLHPVRLSTPTSTVQGHYITCLTVTLTDQEHDQIFSEQHGIALTTLSRTRSRRRLSCRFLCDDSVSFFDSSDGRCSCRGRCFQDFATGSGGSGSHPVSVCSRDSDVDNWTVIQRRVDASATFERGWEEYVRGFGSEDHNYWAGLEEMHLMTLRCRQLEIYIETSDYPPIILAYDDFQIDSEDSDFQLSISGYTTTSSIITYQSFNYNNGMKFTTEDKDNDEDEDRNCATTENRGGWWYRDCTKVNLNGIYLAEGVTRKSLFMAYIGSPRNSVADFKRINYVEMRIRDIN